MSKQFVFALAFTLGMIGASKAQQPIDEMAAQQACQDDAFRLCQATIPDRERTLACLIQNKNGLSGACRTVLASFFPPDPPTKRRSGTTQERANKRGGPVDLSPTANR